MLRNTVIAASFSAGIVADGDARGQLQRLQIQCSLTHATKKCRFLTSGPAGEVRHWSHCRPPYGVPSVEMNPYLRIASGALAARNRKPRSHELRRVHTHVNAFWDSSASLRIILDRLINSTAARFRRKAEAQFECMLQDGDHFQEFEKVAKLFDVGRVCRSANL